jgi:hypothetical protein
MASTSFVSGGKILAVLTLCFWGTSMLRGAAQPAQANDKAPRVPVLVELFTSEGCSDCPPADALLAELDAKQFVPGAEAIVLSEHVTYWNHLGWRDPFSFDAMTQRQEAYGRRFALDSAYTPQVVVDGTSQFVGSDGRAMVAAVARASTKPKMSLMLESVKLDHGTARFAVRAESLKGAKLTAVIAADATHSEVARGENAGRTLHHTAVVRALKEMDGANADGRALTLDFSKAQGAVSTDGAMRLVVFAVDSSGRVIAAAEQPLH